MVGLAGYGSDSAEEEDEEDQDAPEEDEDEAGAKEREEIRRERKKEREREMRMSNMGTEQRAKILARSAWPPFFSSSADSHLLRQGDRTRHLREDCTRTRQTDPLERFHARFSALQPGSSLQQFR